MVMEVEGGGAGITTMPAVKKGHTCLQRSVCVCVLIFDVRLVSGGVQRGGIKRYAYVM